jgi:nicotinate phosphoribosyltransferase
MDHAQAYRELEKQLIQSGYFSAAYFNKLHDILVADDHNPQVLMQVFQRKDSQVLCGMRLVREILQPVSKDLKIRSLEDGAVINNMDTVMTIEGPLQAFAHLESVYLGYLARGTRVASRTHDVVSAANGTPVIFMADRFDTPNAQIIDGYAAHIGGIRKMATDAHGEIVGLSGMGTMPHALIAAYGGDTVRAAKRYAEYYPDEKATVLVDFDNDCVNTTLACAEAIGKRLGAVRLDTSGSNVDESVLSQYQAAQSGYMSEDALKAYKGVCALLVWNVRRALDSVGREDVKIIVSGGFNAEKITRFEQGKDGSLTGSPDLYGRRVPVDVYGVGSNLIKGGVDFTADIVKVDGVDCSKVGRGYRENPLMIEW